MEPTLRGILEKTIDRMLSDKLLEASVVVYKKYNEEGLISSVESAVIGDMLSALRSLFTQYHRRIDEPFSKEAIIDFNNMIDSRAFQIRSRINEVVNR